MTDHDGFVPVGHCDADGLTFEPAPTVTVELADWIAPLAGGNTLTGGVVDGDMVRFDRPDGVVYLRRDVLGLNPDNNPDKENPNG